ncbi:MAG: exodeoxyribonuclease VII small subunit [Desulfuromonadaceae bacterium]|jgi:exodeoxyribonuclease VII small subunit
MAKTKSFEQALKSLEEAVESLEQEDLDLEESLKRFESGVNNAALCQRLLKQVETRVEELMQHADGSFSSSPVSLD